MNKTVYYNDLYDIYKLMLTEKETEYFELYYFENLSLSEIADNVNVSRNAVHKSIKTVEEKLEDFENKLGIYDKKSRLMKLNNPDVNKILENM